MKKKQFIDGIRLVTTTEPDYDAGTPWGREDGHGPVSDWTTRAKLPGERVLNKDRNSYRYYDFAEAVRTARADCWGGQGRTAGERAAHAAESDYRRLRGWCDDRWSYVGVIVTAYEDNDGECGRKLGSASLWGVESDCRDYLADVEAELTEEVLDSVCVRA